MKEREPKSLYYSSESLVDPFELYLFSLISTVGRFLKAVPKGAPIGVAVAVLLYATSQYKPESQVMQLPEVGTSAVSPEPASPIILNRAQRAQNMLDQLRNPSGLSFQEVMSSLGHSVGRIADYSYESRWGIVGSEGLYERAYSSAEDTRVVFELKKWLGVGWIYAGERVDWDAEINVQTGKVLDRFGLLLSDNPESNQLTFIRLGRRIDGKWDWFVEQKAPKPSFNIYLPDVMVRQLEDGSVDYGNGVIGSSLADQNRFK